MPTPAQNTQCRPRRALSSLPQEPPASPSSWAVVKAEGSPSSSITEQLLLGSHMVPTSAMPSVSQVVAPHRSCPGRGEAEAGQKLETYQKDQMGRRGTHPAPGPSRPGTSQPGPLPRGAAGLSFMECTQGKSLRREARWLAEKMRPRSYPGRTWEEIRRYRITLKGPLLSTDTAFQPRKRRLPSWVRFRLWLTGQKGVEGWHHPSQGWLWEPHP